MDPIRSGARGPAVEDVQKRLLKLGFDLGPTGVDGVFLGETLSAVRAFQVERGLAEDGVVGDSTWAALVDATFTLGDRMLYLRMPHLHGADVALLQKALGVLGFPCGRVDGIFGAFTERAVRDFQRSTGQPADGIVGPETVGAMMNLRHVWAGKETAAEVLPTPGSARAADVLEGQSLAVAPRDAGSGAVAKRLVNLAHATTLQARAVVVSSPAEVSGTDWVLWLAAGVATPEAREGERVSVVSARDRDGRLLSARMATALSFIDPGKPIELLVELPDDVGDDERLDQGLAVLLLDAWCAALAGSARRVLE